MSKVRLSLAVICIVSALVFMMHSFLRPKPKLIIKPSAPKQAAEIGYYAFRQIQHQLPDEVNFHFFAEQGEPVELEILQAFLDYGRDKAKLDFMWFSQNLQSLETGEVEEFLEAVEEDKKKDITVFSKRSQRVFISPKTDFFNANFSRSIQYIYFLQVGDEIKNFQCVNWEMAFHLKTQTDLDCFAKNIEPRFTKAHKKTKAETIYAFEKIKPNYYIFYIRTYTP